MGEFKFERVGKTIGRGISFIIYANPGVGKTTMSTTLPEGETLIINTEAGLGPLLGTNHVVFNVMKFVAEETDLEHVIDKLYVHLRTGKHNFKNVVIDNMSELEQQLLLHLTRKHRKENPELKEYGDCAFKMKQWAHNFRDLVYNGINVIFNAWEFPLEIQNTEGCVITKTFPMIGKKIAPQICGLVDVVGHLEVHEKSGRRWVRFAPCNQYLTKSQFKGLENGEVAEFGVIIDKLRGYNYGNENETERTETERGE